MGNIYSRYLTLYDFNNKLAAPRPIQQPVAVIEEIICRQRHTCPAQLRKIQRESAHQSDAHRLQARTYCCSVHLTSVWSFPHTGHTHTTHTHTLLCDIFDITHTHKTHTHAQLDTKFRVKRHTHTHRTHGTTAVRHTRALRHAHCTFHKC